jgi:hypothetical protein
MPIVGKEKQQPHDVRDYDIDFSPWFPEADVIVSASISATPVMPTPPSYAINGLFVKVWVYAGGTDGVSYKITVLATTRGGRVKEVEIVVKIKED